MSDTAHQPLGRAKPFSVNWGARIGWCLLAVYLVYACAQLGFSAERFSAGLEHGQRFLARMFPPNFARWQLIASGIAESLQIAVIATFAGILISLPIGLMASRNLMPGWISWPTRGFIALCRSFHPIIVAILFVKAIGFGALAGVMALIVASIGFISKLFAEAIEEISLKQVEAVRATGACFTSVLIMGVAAGAAALHRVFDLSARFQPAQLDHGGYRRRRRHRCRAVHGLSALRFRRRAGDPDRDR